MKPPAHQPRHAPIHPVCVAAALALTAALFQGCTSTPSAAPREPTPAALHDRDLEGVAAAERSAQPQSRTAAAPQSTPERVALVAGQPATWGDLHAALAEAAGGQVLQELALDRMLEQRARDSGYAVTPQDIERERSAVLRAITRSAQTSESEAQRLLESVRRSRGLGDDRFARLLRRNAILRHLAAPTVTVSDEEVTQAFDIRHGPRHHVRVVVVATDRQASEIREELEQAGGDLDQRRMRLAEIASSRSIDPSASRGGIIEPFNASDPAYPASLRSALKSMQVGDLSPVLAVDRGYAIALLEENTPGETVSLDAAAEGIRAEVRARKERIAMDDIARALIRDANVTVFDRALGWSWRNAEAQTAPVGE